MVKISFYFLVHQPYRIRKVNALDIGSLIVDYFDEDSNRHIFDKISKTSYVEGNKILMNKINEYGDKFKISMVISGTAIEQMMKYSPETFLSFKDLGSTNNVEFIATPYYNSMAGFHSRFEFENQVNQHRNLIKKHFNQNPKIFVNTDLSIDNNILNHLIDMGFNGVLVEEFGSNREVNFKDSKSGAIGIFKRHKNLSDDFAINFFSDDTYNLEQFLTWIRNSNFGSDDILNVFLPFEIFDVNSKRNFGELFSNLVDNLILENEIITPSEALRLLPKVKINSIDKITSKRIVNDLQKDAIAKLYGLEEDVKFLMEKDLLDDFIKLSSLDHFLLMDSDIYGRNIPHFYNMYGSHYDSYLYFMNVLSDLKEKIRERKIAFNSKVIPRNLEDNDSLIEGIRTRIR